MENITNNETENVNSTSNVIVENVGAVKPKKKKKKWWIFLIVAVILIALVVIIASSGESTPEQPAIPRAEYVQNCKEYDYTEISRNPDNYKGQFATFRGQVTQVIENGNSVTLLVSVTPEANEFADGGYLWDDSVWVEYTKSDGTESRILENDIVVMYGMLNGIKTYQSVLGADISVPYVLAAYVDIEK